MTVTSAPMVPQQPASWLESAYAAIDAGYSVFPLQGKFPLEGFSWTKLATKDKAQICQWGLQYPQATGYGIALGADDLVLDIDPRNFPEGRNVEQELLKAFPELLKTRVVKTPGGGYHIYLKKDPSVKIRKSQTDWPGVDFLSEGHYVVGPGSRATGGAAHV